jgi:hypothetical protein
LYPDTIRINSDKLQSTSLQNYHKTKGDSKKAKDSFFKINQQAAPINPTELELIQSRRIPNGLIAKAIIRSGKGHKY